MKTLGIIIACGKEEEIGEGHDVAFLPLGDFPVLVHTLKVFEASTVIDAIVIAVPKDRVDATLHAIKRYGCNKVRGVVVGGASRLSTLRTVYSKLPESASVVVIQEASRPFVKKAVLEETVKACKRYGCAVAAHRIPDAVKYVPKGMKVEKSMGRNTVWAAQTPQAFKDEVLCKLIDSKVPSSKVVDDESEFVCERADIHLVEVGECNMKIRTKKDLEIATALVSAKLV
ncbi:MAG: 2-C-methyl-D-erythritol 4-phosphate cytidylyltransferase [Kiritimatiellaceae bacterium]|nr:2-C-methyl-D-erythritol 4-phosphate cytidylyltransferase [Kiritimatiellaceae bacterium]